MIPDSTTNASGLITGSIGTLRVHTRWFIYGTTVTVSGVGNT